MKFKHLSKLFVSAALGLTMGLGFVVPAYAANINIGNAVEDQTYSAYKIFDVSTSTSGDKTNYSYTLPASETALKTLLEGAGLTFTASGDGSVFMVATGLSTETDAANLAKYLKQHINELGTADGTATGTASGTASITGLDDGYYFVNTTTGTLCILDTTGEADIEEKNETPSVEKKVTSTTSDTDGEPDSAQVGDTVSFEITIHSKPGAENYVLHDKMSDGLTLNQNSIVVKVGETTLTSPDDYSIAYPTGEGSDGCDYEISFTKTYLDSITADTTIIVTYNAVLNENAVVGTDPETNEATLKYGENNNITSTPAETKTYTYDFDLTKTDEDKQPLSGAEFSLYSQEEGGTAINLFDLGNGSYRVATSSDQTTTTTIKVNDQGKATVDGLAGKSYWLEETKAPAGYNMLTERKLVTFNENENPAEADFTNPTIENRAGSLLPSTGGMGTAALYAVGAVLVIGAGVTLVVRRRASHEA